MRASTGRLALFGAFLSPMAMLDTYPKNPGIDALNYAFTLELSDTTDAIAGELALDVRVARPGQRTVRLDLVTATAALNGKGMVVSAVTVDGVAVAYTHRDDVLLVMLPTAPAVDRRARVVVRYRGVPATGLR
ncbi:MAG: hypothetical protein MUF00_20260, partial [Gemmatimonadaceae bacterium]|nr:hypothetical protein [Gemmatimonadaceae bacterium]